MNSHRVGYQYEALAQNYLQQQGLILIAKNVTFRYGELDLIMQDQQTIVFVEVRFRRSASYGGAIESITKNKQQKLIYSAALWLAAQDKSLETTDCRFDLVLITGHQLEWLKNAFSAEN